MQDYKGVYYGILLLFTQEPLIVVKILPESQSPKPQTPSKPSPKLNPNVGT